MEAKAPSYQVSHTPSPAPQEAWNNMQQHSGVHASSPPQLQQQPQQQQQMPHNPTPQPQYHRQQQQQVMNRHNGPPQRWHASYCDFFSPFELCMKAWCCPCFVYGKSAHRIRQNGDMRGYDSMNGSCMLFCGALCFGVNFIPVWMQRADMRHKHNLEGNGCTDCLSACCCPCCDIIQVEKEAEARERGGPVVNGYQAQGGMAYPAPGREK